jgi:hypothetical protein
MLYKIFTVFCPVIILCTLHALYAFDLPHYLQSFLKVLIQGLTHVCAANFTCAAQEADQRKGLDLCQRNGSSPLPYIHIYI